jgi:hypothetical protein
MGGRAFPDGNASIVDHETEPSLRSRAAYRSSLTSRRMSRSGWSTKSRDTTA